VSSRTLWKIFCALLVASTLFTTGAEKAAQRAAQLTLTWVDNSGGIANFVIGRKAGPTSTYARIATTGPGITTYTDAAVVAGTTNCDRVKASNTLGESGYSNEACGSAAGVRTPLDSCCARWYRDGHTGQR
jgi:hypothetical protein